MQAKTADRLFWVSGWAYDFSKIATIILVLGLLVHYFFFSVLVVRGASMEPNFTDGEVLGINKITYTIHDPQRGDVIAMYFPGETQKRFIKRVIGLPGDKLSIHDNRVMINGTLLSESYLPDTTDTVADIDRTLAPGEYFVMGDNRAVSSDSRAWGAVPKSYIIGKVGREIIHLPSSHSATVF